MLLGILKGSAESLVSSQVNPEAVDPSLSTSQTGFSLKRLKSLLQCRSCMRRFCRLLAYFGRPMDIEWCAVQGAVYLLQTRPITTVPTKIDSGQLDDG